MTKTFLVSGRLNHGRMRRFALRFKQARDDYFALTDHSGDIAYEPESLGRGHLVVFTNRGPLEIASDISLEPPPNIVIIDERNWKTAARYYDDCLDLSFLTRPLPIVIWDQGRRRCASIDETGARVVSSRCPKPKPIECKSLRQMTVEFVPADIGIEQIDAYVRDLRSLRLSANQEPGYFGGAGWGLRAYRVSDSNHLVPIGRCGDCF